MNQTSGWWNDTSAKTWHDVLACINGSRQCCEPFDRCERLCAALDKSWTALAQDSPSFANQPADAERSRVSDAQRCFQLFQQACSPACLKSFVMTDALRDLALFSPPIMNESAISQSGGKEGDIPAAVRNRAAATRARLREVYDRYQTDANETGQLEILLESLARVIDRVRCNGGLVEKPLEGPQQGWGNRDTRVVSIVSDVVDEFFEHMFAFPSQRLAVYGTLAPGEMNAHLLAGVAGNWGPGDVRGRFGRRHGYPIFSWDPVQPARAIQVLTAATLREYWPRLDEFEGEHYRRILVPVETAGGTAVCNIYEANEPV